MVKMQLLEQLQYHIDKLNEDHWGYTRVSSGIVEYVEDPKNDNSFRKFIKDSGNYARCAFVKGKWYFWPAKHAIHHTFINSLGLMPYWDKDLKLEVQMNGNSLELGFQIIGDWEELVRNQLEGSGQVSKDTMNTITKGTAMILDLHKKYGLKLSRQDLFRLKGLLANRKPASIRKYDQLYQTDRWSDKSKIARKQHKYNDKSLPKKDRGSRFGWQWSNDSDKFDLDLGDLY